MMRLMLVAALAAVSVGLATPVSAGSNFAAYDGRDAVQEGQGGTKITTDGVDFWTTGAPPHKYQILGVLTDKRGSGLFSGKAVGGSGVAGKVLAVGGNAALVLDQNTETTGAMVSNGVIGVARRNTTRFVVVKYLD